MFGTDRYYANVEFSLKKINKSENKLPRNRFGFACSGKVFNIISALFRRSAGGLRLSVRKYNYADAAAAAHCVKTEVIKYGRRANGSEYAFGRVPGTGRQNKKIK